MTIKAKPYLQPKEFHVHRTETCLNARSCEFKPFEMEMSRYGGWDSIIEFEIWDQDKKGRLSFVGRCKTTLREMSFFKTNPRLVLKNPKRKGNIGYRHSGLLYICHFNPIAAPEDYAPEKVKYDQVELTIIQGSHVPPQQTVQVQQPGLQHAMSQQVVQVQQPVVQHSM